MIPDVSNDQIEYEKSNFIDFVSQNIDRKQIADDIIRISKEFNVDAQIIGRVEESIKKQVTIRSAYGEFNYV